MHYWWIPVVLLPLPILFFLLRPHWRHKRNESRFMKARETFRQRREWLELRFFTLASQSGFPRGLDWADCEFENAVSYARDRGTGELRALVGVSIQFQAIEGGGMEDNPNVSSIRAATAVFRFDRDEWVTDGRALFNLNPTQAIERYHHELETVD